MFFCGCGQDVADSKRDLDRDLDEFVDTYNSFVARYLDGEVTSMEAEMSQAEGDKLKELETSMSVLTARQRRGDYFQFKPSSELPVDLQWQNGADQPEVGDERATKGGAFHYYMVTFPPTMRGFASNANGPWRSILYDEISVDLVEIHPHTGKAIPGTASEWALADEGKTVYYRIDPDATYTTGEKITARDMLVTAYIRLSDYTVGPYWKQYFRESMSGMTWYGDDVVAFHVPTADPFLEVSVPDGLPPASPTFYADYGPDFMERYNWKRPPGTGAYYIKNEDIVKGVSISLTRKPNWWGEKKKFWQYRYNPDKMVYRVVRDTSKAFELFRIGQLDYSGLSSAEYWYEKSEIEPVFNGYIERYTFFNQYPRVPYGLHINSGIGLLKDDDVREGIHYATNFQRVIDVVFLGDYSRLDNFTTGYALFDRDDIKARPFDVNKARELFAKAGFTEQGDDGILRRKDGTRLEIPITHTEHPRLARMIGLLKEEAKKAGLEYRLDSQEGTVLGKYVRQKKHHAVWWGWGASPPKPAYYEFLHSKNAYDAKGELKANTNNIYSVADPKIDKMVEAYRASRSVDEMRVLSHELQQVFYDEAVFVPAYKIDFQRFATWRWIKWPDTPSSRLMPQGVYYPYESHVFWIDEELKKETQEAMASGETFPEVQQVWDDYKSGVNENE